MAQVWVQAAAWRALTAEQQNAIRAQHVVPETGWLNEPATLVDPLVDSGVEGAPPVVLAGEWCVFDDPLADATHAEAIAAGLELWLP